jgi:hypothetical protein
VRSAATHDEARALGRGRAARTPLLMIAVVAAVIAVVAGLVVLAAFLISSNS